MLINVGGAWVNPLEVTAVWPGNGNVYILTEGNSTIVGLGGGFKLPSQIEAEVERVGKLISEYQEAELEELMGMDLDPVDDEALGLGLEDEEVSADDPTDMGAWG